MMGLSELAGRAAASLHRESAGRDCRLCRCTPAVLVGDRVQQGFPGFL